MATEEKQKQNQAMQELFKILSEPEILDILKRLMIK